MPEIRVGQENSAPITIHIQTPSLGAREVEKLANLDEVAAALVRHSLDLPALLGLGEGFASGLAPHQ